MEREAEASLKCIEVNEQVKGRMEVILGKLLKPEALCVIYVVVAVGGIHFQPKTDVRVCLI